MSTVSLDKFDPRCTWHTTGVGAIWVAYRWGMWEQLRQIGLPRSEFLPLFQKFEDEHVLNRRGLLRSQAQALELERLDPRIRNAAGRLVGYYVMVHAEENPAIMKELLDGTRYRHLPYRSERIPRQ